MKIKNGVNNIKTDITEDEAHIILGAMSVCASEGLNFTNRVDNCTLVEKGLVKKLKEAYPEVCEQYWVVKEIENTEEKSNG